MKRAQERYKGEGGGEGEQIRNLMRGSKTTLAIGAKENGEYVVREVLITVQNRGDGRYERAIEYPETIADNIDWYGETKEGVRSRESRDRKISFLGVKQEKPRHFVDANTNSGTSRATCLALPSPKSAITTTVKGDRPRR